MTDQNEDRIQTDCYVWFHNKFPKLRGLLCYNLNNSKNKIAGAKNKAMGLQKGRSDLVLYYKGKAYMIEMKTEDGKQTKDQKIWQATVVRNGFKYYLARNINEFKIIIYGCLQNSDE